MRAGFDRAAALDWYGVPVLLCVLLFWTAAHKPLRAEHFVIGLTFTVLAWAAPASRRLAWAALPFPVAGLLYENFGRLEFLRGPVHVADLYWADHALFSIQGQVLPLWFQMHTHPLLDAITGAAYAIYLPWIMGVAFVLFFHDIERTRELAWAFLVSNLIGMVIWVVFAAAPPWYVAEYGLGPALEHVAPSAAGASRFDALFGINYFAGFYARNSNVFGAMPSLHVAYPLLAVFASWQLGPRTRWITCGFVALVAFSAVYLGHHYVLDVVAGLAVACVTQVLVTGVRRRLLAAPGWPWERPWA